MLLAQALAVLRVVRLAAVGAAPEECAIMCDALADELGGDQLAGTAPDAPSTSRIS